MGKYSDKYLAQEQSRELSHHGVLGMKWGVRKRRSAMKGATASVKKARGDVYRKEQQGMKVGSAASNKAYGKLDAAKKARRSQAKKNVKGAAKDVVDFNNKLAKKNRKQALDNVKAVGKAGKKVVDFNNKLAKKNRDNSVAGKLIARGKDKNKSLAAQKAKVAKAKDSLFKKEMNGLELGSKESNAGYAKINKAKAEYKAAEKKWKGEYASGKRFNDAASKGKELMGD